MNIEYFISQAVGTTYLFLPGIVAYVITMKQLQQTVVVLDNNGEVRVRIPRAFDEHIVDRVLALIAGALAIIACLAMANPELSHTLRAVATLLMPVLLPALTYKICSKTAATDEGE